MYYRRVVKGRWVWWLAGQYRTVAMAEERAATMAVDAIPKDLDVRVRRVDLDVPFGVAPETLPDTRAAQNR